LSQWGGKKSEKEKDKDKGEKAKDKSKDAKDKTSKKDKSRSSPEMGATGTADQASESTPARSPT
jgi:hypothetical protein